MIRRFRSHSSQKRAKDGHPQLREDRGKADRPAASLGPDKLVREQVPKLHPIAQHQSRLRTISSWPASRKRNIAGVFPVAECLTSQHIYRQSLSLRRIRGLLTSDKSEPVWLL